MQIFAFIMFVVNLVVVIFRFFAGNSWERDWAFLIGWVIVYELATINKNLSKQTLKKDGE